MRKTPLNNATRNDIQVAMLQHRFGKQAKELKERPAKLGDTVYKEMLTPDERARINKAPANWFDTTSCLHVYVDGKSIDLPLTKSVRKPYHWQSNHSYGVNLNSGASAAGKSIVQYWADREAYETERSKASLAVGATLRAFKYIEDLIEQWPESKKFIKLAEKVQTTALAIPPKQLNEMLGLS